MAKAMTAEDTTEHRRYRIDPEVLTADAVYSFCESRDEGTRALGMELIERHPRSEVARRIVPPDRKPRPPGAGVCDSQFLVVVPATGHHGGLETRTAAGIPNQTQTQNEAQSPEDIAGSGPPPKPEHLPAEAIALRRFLRRMLFELPPGRPKRKPRGSGHDPNPLKTSAAPQSEIGLDRNAPRRRRRGGRIRRIPVAAVGGVSSLPRPQRTGGVSCGRHPHSAFSSRLERGTNSAPCPLNFAIGLTIAARVL